jgi:hypothetical protein
MGFSAVMLTCWMAAMSTAAAAPPVRLPDQTRGPADGATSLSHRLDLRMPTGPEAIGNDGLALSRFSRPHRGSEPRAADESEATTPTQQPTRVMGNVEAFAHRFKREGLPVARLWENHAALVSLGLNSKGKPGLWLVQKIP